jgi:hypothetical protein
LFSLPAPASVTSRPIGNSNLSTKAMMSRRH